MSDEAVHGASISHRDMNPVSPKLTTARYLGKKAACLVTVTDSTGPDGVKIALPAADREQALRDMMVVALEAAIVQ